MQNPKSASDQVGIDVMELIKQTIVAASEIRGDDSAKPTRKCQLTLRLDCAVIRELEWAAAKAGSRKTTLATALLTSAVGDLVSRMRAQLDEESK